MTKESLRNRYNEGKHPLDQFDGLDETCLIGDEKYIDWLENELIKENTFMGDH